MSDPPNAPERQPADADAGSGSGSGSGTLWEWIEAYSSLFGYPIIFVWTVVAPFLLYSFAPIDEHSFLRRFPWSSLMPIGDRPYVFLFLVALLVVWMLLFVRVMPVGVALLFISMLILMVVFLSAGLFTPAAHDHAGACFAPMTGIDGHAHTSHFKRSDGLYVAVDLLTTAGTGELQPASSQCRRLATAQMAMDFLLLGFALALLMGRLSSRPASKWLAAEGAGGEPSGRVTGVRARKPRPRMTRATPPRADTPAAPHAPSVSAGKTMARACPSARVSLWTEAVGSRFVGDRHGAQGKAAGGALRSGVGDGHTPTVSQARRVNRRLGWAVLPGAKGGSTCKPERHPERDRKARRQPAAQRCGTAGRRC